MKEEKSEPVPDMVSSGKHDGFRRNRVREMYLPVIRIFSRAYCSI